MPSFLSKVFGRKKDSPVSSEDNGSVTLLDGKFESVSPTSTRFPEAVNGRSESNPSPLSLFRPKSRVPPSGRPGKRVEAPHLSLNFPTIGDNTNSRSLGVVFEVDPETLEPLADSVISQRQLNLTETLSLIQTCSKAITERGLETLGVMHPHWHSASPESQRKLLTLFIHSLASSSNSPTSPPPSAYATAFQNEVSSSRSPHDIAAILRWGLRHMELESKRFGKDDQWYNTFSSAERQGDYPSNAFSVILSPQLPAAHLELLKTILELVSYLAAHSDTNGSSGSKISKFFGLWLLEAEQARNGDNWDAFYARWERAGRILEHLFLARIRDEATSSRLPTRLIEPIKKYPYGGTSPDTNLLPRPRFSTYQYDALFVHIDTEYTSSKFPKHHPFRLLADAFKGETTAEGVYVSLWELIKKIGSDESSSSPGGYAGVGRVFADETIRLLSCLPSDTANPGNPFTRASSPSARRRSFSVGDQDGATPTSPVAYRPKSPVIGSPTSPSKIQDWGDFMSAGFASSEDNEEANTSLAATLIKAELEPSKHLGKGARNGSARKSLEAPRSRISAAEEQIDDASFVSRSTNVQIVQLDEAFIDFWSDAILDRVTSDWPGFVICKLKPTLSGLEVDGKRIEWLIIERQYKRPVPVAQSVDSDHLSPDFAGRNRPSSPRSFKGDMSITTSLKRLSFLSASFSSKAPKTPGGKKSKTGEMGEALIEEDESEEKSKEKSKSRTSLAIPKIRVPSPKSKRASEISHKSAEGEKKYEESAATDGLGLTAAAATSAVAVAIAVATSASEASPEVAKEEIKSEALGVVKATKEVEIPTTNGHAALVADEPKAAPAAEEPAVAPQETPAPVVEAVTPAPAVEVPKVEVTEPVVVVAEEPIPAAVAQVELPANIEEPEVKEEEPTPAPVAVAEPVIEVVKETEAVAVTSTSVAEAVKETEEITPTPVEPIVKQDVTPAVPVPEVEPTPSAPESSAVVEPVVEEPVAVPEMAPEAVKVEEVSPEVEVTPGVAATRAESTPEVLERSLHSEPLAVPDYTPGDNKVDLPPVPIVEAVPEYPIQEPAEALVPAIVAPIQEPVSETQDVEVSVEGVIAQGETPGPQTLLDHVVEEAEKKEDPEVTKTVEE